MLVTADQIMYQKEHPDENLKKINKFHKKSASEESKFCEENSK